MLLWPDPRAQGNNQHVAVARPQGSGLKVFEDPLSLEQALARVQSWLDQPCTRVVRPAERHWTVFKEVLTDGQAVGNLATDAHLAALAIEHGCELASTDSTLVSPNLSGGTPSPDRSKRRSGWSDQ